MECFDDPAEDVEKDTELVDSAKVVLVLLEKDKYVVKVVIPIVMREGTDWGTTS